jgi:Histone H1-like protein Hc1
MNRYNDLMEAVKALEADFEKFFTKGQAAAGTRVRKGLSDLRKLAQEVRKEIQDVKAQRKADKSSQ